MKDINKKFFQWFSKFDKYILLIFGFSLVILYSFLSNQYVKGHDSLYHYSNIFALGSNIDFTSLKFFPGKVLPIIAYGFGWGEGIFYPSLPHYVAVYIYKLISLFGITNVFSAMKICHFIVLFLSGLFMYLLAKKVFNNKNAGLVSAVIYMTFPYHYIDIMVRDAFSECFLFMFVPLIFLGIEYLLEGNYKKFLIYFVIGYAFCINCHLALSIYLTIFVLLYLILNYKKVFNKQTIKMLFVAAFLIILLVLPFVVPLILHTINGNYTVYIKDLMYNSDLIKVTSVKPLQYFSFERPLAWTGDLVFTISFPALIVVIINLIKFKKLKEYESAFKYFFCFIAAVIMMLPIFPLSKFPSIFWSIQFVWRLNLFLVFFMSVFAGGIVYVLKDKFKGIATIIILSLLMMFSFHSMVILDYLNNMDYNVNKYGAASYQYIPAKAYKNLDYVKKRDKKVHIVKGEAKITNFKSDVPNLSFKIKTDDCVLELPRYYFIGYDIKLNGHQVKYKENKNGFIEVKLKTSGNLSMKYTGGLLYRISVLISLITLLVCIFLLYLHRNDDKK